MSRVRTIFFIFFIWSSLLLAGVTQILLTVKVTSYSSLFSDILMYIPHIHYQCLGSSIAVMRRGESKKQDKKHV